MAVAIGRLSPNSAGIALFLSILFCAIVAGRAWAGPTGTQFVMDELLVKGKDGVAKAKFDDVVRGAGATELSEIPQLQIKRLRVPAHALAKVKAALARNSAIEFVEENFLAQGAAVPNDTSYGAQWHLPKIAAPQGWDITTGSSNVIIAVIDSGIDPAHPDLAGKLLPGYNFVVGNTDTHDVKGHGTAVAGAAAALTNNGTGVAGVAWGNPLMPLVVLDATGYGTYANMASAITYAADHGARVLNLSIAGSSSSTTLQNAVNYAWNKGTVVVAAAANNATSTPYYPAACANVVAVAATDQNDVLASFSNFGSWVDVAAPGYSIYSTVNGGSYGFWSGTSFSSPITAGLVALIWAANPALANAEVVDLLTRSADDLGAAGFDNTYGHGRINAYKALTLAKTFTPAIDTTSPAVAITSPAAGVTITGQLSVVVSALDDIKVTRIELFIDGVLAGSASSAPGNFPWDTATLADGWHTLSAKAYDAAGNVGQTGEITVYISNPTQLQDQAPPVVAITSPYPGAQLASNTSVSAQASDNVGVVKLELYIDGQLKASKAASSLTWAWNTRKAKVGAHTITAKAYDAAGNSMSDSLTVYK